MPRQKRVPVMIDDTEYQRYKFYSDVTGVPISRVIREALEDFATVSLAARLEALTGSKEKTPVICIDAFAATAGSA